MTAPAGGQPWPACTTQRRRDRTASTPSVRHDGDEPRIDESGVWLTYRCSAAKARGSAKRDRRLRPLQHLVGRRPVYCARGEVGWRTTLAAMSQHSPRRCSVQDLAIGATKSSYPALRTRRPQLNGHPPNLNPNSYRCRHRRRRRHINEDIRRGSRRSELGHRTT